MFLLKPIDAPDLLAAIEGLLRAPAVTADSAVALAQLRASRRHTFAKEAPAQLGELARAATAQDSVALAKVAHEFGNAAFALQNPALGEASAELERVARTGGAVPRDLPERVAAAARAILEEPFASISLTGAKPKP